MLSADDGLARRPRTLTLVSLGAARLRVLSSFVILS